MCIETFFNRTEHHKLVMTDRDVFVCWHKVFLFLDVLYGINSLWSKSISKHITAPQPSIIFMNFLCIHSGLFVGQHSKTGQSKRSHVHLHNLNSDSAMSWIWTNLWAQFQLEMNDSRQSFESDSVVTKIPLK